MPRNICTRLQSPHSSIDMALLVWLHRFVFSFVHMNEGKDLVFDMAVHGIIGLVT